VGTVGHVNRRSGLALRQPAPFPSDPFSPRMISLTVTKHAVKRGR
jgi:hypothetical protein